MRSLKTITILFFLFVAEICFAKINKNINTIINFQIDKVQVKAEKISSKAGIRVRINENAEIYILNSLAHDITVLDTNYKVKKRIGGFGQGPGEFYSPEDFAIDSNNNIYVVDGFNSRLQILDAAGEYKQEIKLDNSTNSVTILNNNDIYINKLTDNTIFSKVDVKNHNIVKSLGAYSTIPFLAETVTKIFSDKEERKNWLRRFTKLLNMGIVRANRAHEIFFLFDSKPIIRKYGVSGQLIFEKKITTPTTDSLMQRSRMALQRNMARKNLLYNVISQDFFISPENDNIYVILTGESPSIYGLDASGNLQKEINLVDGDNNLFSPVGLCYYRDNKWIGINSQGIYMFTMP